MPPEISDLGIALNALKEFRKYSISSHHERFIFPFLCGSYFTYRKVDVERITSIAKAISKDPTYLDVGCGYGDFLEKIIQYLPNAEGIEKSADIFFKLGRYKPDYIKIGDAYNGIEKKYDLIFVGWMEPGVDYRDKIAASTDVIITTFDKGGQCGINGECEMDEYGFEKIASWITPSWIDVNTELLNKYYSKISPRTVEFLKQLRGAHNLWYVYSKPKYKDIIKETLIKSIKKDYKKDVYVHEKILDECGFSYNEMLPSNPDICLWKINFEE